jgi:hypothetical protein
MLSYGVFGGILTPLLLLLLLLFAAASVGQPFP